MISEVIIIINGEMNGYKRKKIIIDLFASCKRRVATSQPNASIVKLTMTVLLLNYLIMYLHAGLFRLSGALNLNHI